MSDRISIEQASAQQLRDFASLVFGLELTGTENKAVMTGKLKAVGYDKEDIPVMGGSSPAASKPAAGAGAVQENGDGRDCMKILIPEEDKDGGQEPVFVSVNGSAMYIPRAKPVLVPLPYIEALQNAVQFVYPQYDGEEGGLGEPRKVHSYPFAPAA